jgi:hypothetical protein
VNRSALLVVGLLLLAAGSLFTLQGLGILGGSAMSGVRLWAIVGPIVALAGVVLAVRSRRRS